MRPLTNAELLRAWETGLERSQLDATLLLLATACSANNIEEVARLSIGDRDLRLLQIREWLFGKRLDNLVKCPRCGELIEWECDLADFYIQPLSTELTCGQYKLKSGNIDIHFRLPNSLDLAKAISEKWNSKAILSSCVIEVYKKNKKISTDCLTDDAWNALDKKMSELEPQADIRININCPVCVHHWQTSFDIVSHLWTEIGHRVQRLMQEVCVLARAFGWSEKDILDMTNHRRQVYIEMLRA